MYNLENHEAYSALSNMKVIHGLIEELLQEKNFCYNKFNEKIVKDADDLADILFANNSTSLYSTRTFSSKEELANKIKGDIFELFVMFFLQYFERQASVLGIKEGTYTQVTDDEDAGMDFYGIKYSSGNNERVFGQIKYRNPFLNLKPEEMAFTRKVAYSLIGDATIKMGFNAEKDFLLFVTNRTLEDSLHYRFKNEIGFVNTSADSNHTYIKFLDANLFQNTIGFNEATFWNEFKNQFK